LRVRDARRQLPSFIVVGDIGLTGIANVLAHACRRGTAQVERHSGRCRRSGRKADKVCRRRRRLGRSRRCETGRQGTPVKASPAPSKLPPSLGAPGLPASIPHKALISFGTTPTDLAGVVVARLDGKGPQSKLDEAEGGGVPFDLSCSVQAAALSWCTGSSRIYPSQGSDLVRHDTYRNACQASSRRLGRSRRCETGRQGTPVKA
jgi:hypothetical protein